jgi:hypothetical protein
VAIKTLHSFREPQKCRVKNTFESGRYTGHSLSILSNQKTHREHWRCTGKGAPSRGGDIQRHKRTGDIQETDPSKAFYDYNTNFFSLFIFFSLLGVLEVTIWRKIIFFSFVELVNLVQSVRLRATKTFFFVKELK